MTEFIKSIAFNKSREYIESQLIGIVKPGVLELDKKTDLCCSSSELSEN